MSDIDYKLRKLLSDAYDIVGENATIRLNHDGYIEQIKQVFADAGYITPEQVKRTQELVNQMANLAQDMAKLPVTIHECVHASGDWMTGKDWYNRFKKEFRGVPSGKGYASTYNIINAAKRASGIADD